MCIVSGRSVNVDSHENKGLLNQSVADMFSTEIPGTGDLKEDTLLFVT